MYENNFFFNVTQAHNKNEKTLTAASLAPGLWTEERNGQSEGTATFESALKYSRWRREKQFSSET